MERGSQWSLSASQGLAAGRDSPADVHPVEPKAAYPVREFWTARKALLKAPAPKARAYLLSPDPRRMRPRIRAGKSLPSTS